MRWDKQDLGDGASVDHNERTMISHIFRLFADSLVSRAHQQDVLLATSQTTFQQLQLWRTGEFNSVNWCAERCVKLLERFYGGRYVLALILAAVVCIQHGPTIV